MIVVEGICGKKGFQRAVFLHFPSAGQEANQDDSDTLFNEKGDNEHERDRGDNLIAFFRPLVL